MICPQTNAKCDATRCLKYGCCGPSECPPKPVECSDFNLFTSPPKPTMAEIERLVDAVIAQTKSYQRYKMQGWTYDHVIAARAALLAAVRQLAGENKC